MSRYYWVPIPGTDQNGELPGKLIALEGTDCVGRSTQMQLIRTWLESSGLAVYDTGLTRGQLAGQHIQDAKEGHTMGPRTQCLFYATDFADRLEMEIVPALRAGYVVLTDRYVYSLMARAAVRGMDREWLKKLYGFALKPDLTIYLEVTLDRLLPRVLEGGGFDYWESGMDYLAAGNMHDAFVRHQSALLREFEQMAKEYGWVVVDANRGIQVAFAEVRGHVQAVVEGMRPPDATFAAGPAALMPPATHRDERRSMGDRLRDLFANLLDDLDS